MNFSDFQALESEPSFSDSTVSDLRTTLLLIQQLVREERYEELRPVVALAYEVGVTEQMLEAALTLQL